jgi:hypothetical protein
VELPLGLIAVGAVAAAFAGLRLALASFRTTIGLRFAIGLGKVRGTSTVVAAL